MKFNIKTLTRTTVLASLFTFLWFYPWQPWANSLSWFRYLIGLSLFILPGLLINLAITNRRYHMGPSCLTNGFTISIFITGFLGVIARITNSNFSLVDGGLYLVGLVGFALFAVKTRGEKPNQIKRLPIDVWLSLTILVGLGATILAANIAIPPRIYEDDFTYNALLHYFQAADAYTFDFQSALNRMEIARFWIAFWPLVEAVLADLSGIHGLLVTGIYIAPTLVVLATLAIYSLGRSLGFSQNIALLAVLAQLASLLRLTQESQAGIYFFNKFPEDKVVAAFALAPVVFRLAIEALDQPDRRRLLLVALGTGALAFTHPVMLGFAVMIIGLTGILYLAKTRAIRPLITIMATVLLILAVPLYIRLVEGSGITEFTMAEVAGSSKEAKLNTGRLAVLENEKYFGISTWITRGLPYESFWIAGVLGLAFLWRKAAASYVAASALVLAVAIFPYTGWIIALFSSAFQLWRLTWLMPFGIAFAFLVDTVTDWLVAIPKLEKTRPVFGKIVPLILSLALCAGMVYVLPWAKGNLHFGVQKPGSKMWYQDYIEAGEVLVQVASEGDIILGGPDRQTNDIIPSLTQKLQLVSFRNERGGRTAAVWEAMVAEDTPPQERLDLFREYQLKYLLIRVHPGWMDGLMESHPEMFRLIYQNRKLRLFEFQP